MNVSLDSIRELQSQFPTLGLIGNTPIVELDVFRDEFPNVRLLAKVEGFNPGGSLKDRPVLFMMGGALSSGQLGNGQVVLDLSLIHI